MLLWVAILICLAIVVAIQYRAFGTGTKSRKPDNIASFFLVRELTERWQHNLLATASVVPLSFMFVLLAHGARPIGERLVELYGGTNEWGKLATAFFEHAPEATFPFVFLIFLFLIFGAQLRYLFQNIEKGVLHIAGIPTRTNKIVRDYAVFLLKNRDYEKILCGLEKGRLNKLPLPEELEERGDERKASFQLLHLAKTDIGRYGLREALARIVEAKFSDLVEKNEVEYGALREPEGSGLGTTVSRLSDLKWFHMFAGIVAFMIVGGLYIGITPMAGNFFEGLGIGWPAPSAVLSLLWGVLLVALGTIFPMIVGILLFAKRMDRAGETSATVSHLGVCDRVSHFSSGSTFPSLYCNESNSLSVC